MNKCPRLENQTIAIEFQLSWFEQSMRLSRSLWWGIDMDGWNRNKIREERVASATYRAGITGYAHAKE